MKNHATTTETVEIDEDNLAFAERQANALGVSLNDYLVGLLENKIRRNFTVLDGTGSTPSCDDCRHVKAGEPVPEVYEFKPVTYYWRKQIRSAEYDLGGLAQGLRAEILLHRSELLRIGVPCDLSAPRGNGSSLDECLALVDLLEQHRAAIYRAGWIPPIVNVPRSYDAAFPARRT